MNSEEALEILDNALRATKQKPLTNTERLVFNGSWQAKTYEKIAQEYAEKTDRYYSPNYLKQDVGPNLWNKISQVIKKINSDSEIESDSSFRVSKNKLKTGIQRLKVLLQELNKQTNKSEKDNLKAFFFIVKLNNVELHEVVAKISDCLKDIQENAQDYSIEYIEIKEGSVIIVLKGSLAGFNRLQTRFINNEFQEILGWAIENIELDRELTDITEWLENLFNKSWQPPEQILTTTSIRSKAIADNWEEITVSKSKVLQIAESQSVIIIVQFSLLTDREIQVNLQIYPALDNTYLPEGLVIEVLDELNETALREEVNKDLDSIQIQFILEVTEKFKIRLTLDNISTIENLFDN